VTANNGLTILNFAPETGFVGRFKSRFLLEQSVHNLAISSHHPFRSNFKGDSREGLIGSVGMGNVLSEQMRPT
jgi:hypothetical protein